MGQNGQRAGVLKTPIESRAIQKLGAVFVVLAGLTASAPASAQAQSFAPDGIEISGYELDSTSPDCTIVGTEGDDLLRGTDGVDVICGLGGDDRILGFGDSDVIRGGPGDDTIFGDDGADVIEGGPGNDKIFGGSGPDLVAGDAGDDVVYGGVGDDVLVASLRRTTDDIGADRFIGGDGDDELAGGYQAGQGAGARYEPLTSVGGVFIGGPGVDRIFGTLGDDTVYVGRDGGIASGLAGDDLLVGSGDSVTEARSPFCADTTAAELVADGEVPPPGSGSFAATNVLIGGDGDDVLLSGGGRSCMAGSRGSDDFYGSPYADSIWTGGDASDPTAFPSPGGETVDRDWVIAKDGDDAIWGSLGDELVYGSLGDDSFVADPRFRSADPTADVGGDVYLGFGDDLLVGGFGDDYLDGDFGSDRIFGGPGNDDTWPGNDDAFDLTDGGAGDDICTRYVPDRAISCETVYDRPFPFPG